MNQSFLPKLIVSVCCIATWGCQSQTETVPPKKMPPVDQAPCYDGNGNKECTDEAKKETPKAADSVVAPVAQEEVTPSEPQGASQAAVEQPVISAPSAEAETPSVAPAAVPEASQIQAAESLPVAPAPVAEVEAPKAPVSL